jgi:hypothetical protein
MAAPWIVSVKDISRSGSTTHGNKNVPVSAGFVAPSLPSSLSFGPTALFGAMAKMQALKTASPALSSALLTCFAALTEAVVDETGVEFDLVADLERLEQSARAALTGAIGAGVCHLYMSALGYVWNTHASSIIKAPSGVGLADFVYDGGAAGGHGIVLAEAKGAFSSATSAVDVQTDADKGYLNQVDPHIGARPRNGAVVHGYAIAFGAQPESVRAGQPRPNAFLHIAETDVQPAASVSGGTSTVDSAIALGNYRSAFMLARAPLVVEAIDWMRGGSHRLDLLERTQLFSRVRAGTTVFFVGHPEAADEWAYEGFYHRNRGLFAVEATVAWSFLDQLSAIIRADGAPPRLELPAAPLDLHPEGANAPIVFADGFAVVPGRKYGEETLRWSPQIGWI